MGTLMLANLVPRAALKSAQLVNSGKLRAVKLVLPYKTMPVAVVKADRLSEARAGSEYMCMVAAVVSFGALRLVISVLP